MDRAVAKILLEARKSLRSAAHPMRVRALPFLEHEGDPNSGSEVALDETLEAALARGARAPNLTDLQIHVSETRPQPVCISIDTSLSMTGEKLALTAVALGVVCLQFPREKMAVLSFEHEARILKRPDEICGAREVLRRFLLSPTQGYTDLEEGLRVTLDCIPSFSGRAERPVATLLLTDGKYTAGKDPTYLASRFPSLHVLKMGRDSSSEALCRDLARFGRGRLYGVAELRALPASMVAASRDLLRGAFLR